MIALSIRPGAQRLLAGEHDTVGQMKAVPRWALATPGISSARRRRLARAPRFAQRPLQVGLLALA